MMRVTRFLRYAALCLVILSLCGCLGNRRKRAQEKRRKHESLMQILNVSGKRVVFHDQYGDVLGKWRIRKHFLKVYDEKLRPSGSVRVTRDNEHRFVAINAIDADGKTQSIAPEQDQSRYSFGDRFQLERSGTQWILSQVEPYERLARFTFQDDALDVSESRPNKNPVIRRVSRTSDGEVIVEDGRGKRLWVAPAPISVAQSAPFVLRHSSLTALERGMLARFLEVKAPAQPSQSP